MQENPIALRLKTKQKQTNPKQQPRTHSPGLIK